jgi:acyl-coenzyme A thioesterase PaaI-like protein
MQNIVLRSSFLAVSTVFVVQKQRDLIINNDVKMKPITEGERALNVCGIKLSEVERIDPLGNEKIRTIFNFSEKGKHVLHHTLAKKGGIEKYEIYKYNQPSKDKQDEVIAIIKFGDAVCGHPKVVHGGIISTMIDNTYGWVFIAGRKQIGFTANLNVNFRKPIGSDQLVILKSKLVEQKGRKYKLEATIRDMQGQVLVESTALFLQPREMSMYLLYQRNDLWLSWLEFVEVCSKYFY